MQFFNRMKELGVGFVAETLFERFVPAWLFRFSRLAIYQLDNDKLSASSSSTAAVKICAGDEEVEQLKEITSEGTAQIRTIGVLAEVDGAVAGGLWVAISDYQDRDLGLAFNLGDEGGWVYAARVDAAYRRQGIYSHLMAVAVQTRQSQGHASPLIAVSVLNKGSHKAIGRFGTPVGKITILRLGMLAWAWSSGDLQQQQSFTPRCTSRPIEFNVT